jgi:hypothetical protein
MTEETVSFEEVVEAKPAKDPNEEMKAEYIAYVEEIKAGRYSCDTRQEALENINAICKVLELTTVVPRTELQTREGQRTPIIIGGTNIDLVKSQYPGLYPVLVERLLELTVKL